jgi:hypothetical protein
VMGVVALGVALVRGAGAYSRTGRRAAAALPFVSREPEHSAARVTNGLVVRDDAARRAPASAMRTLTFALRGGATDAAGGRCGAGQSRYIRRFAGLAREAVMQP